jgi:hypothetical protein
LRRCRSRLGAGSILVPALAVAFLVGATACGAKAAPDNDPGAPNQGAVPAGAAAAAAPPSTPSTPAPAPPTTVAATTTTVDPGTLPQTNDKPSATDPGLATRNQALWQAIVADDPSIALPAFFPLTAYQQVKDLKDPTTDWHNRLIGAFNSEIHGYHKQLGANPAAAQLVSVDIPMANAQWINPHVEYNKIGYWRVYGTTLKYQVNGKMQSLKVASLISWRGQWYVVHLASIPS